MPSDYFNLLLSEIRSAESSGKWDAVGLLFFHVGMFNPPEEEVALIRARLAPQAYLTDPFEGIMGSGWAPFKWLEDFISRRDTKDLSCHLLYKSFGNRLWDSDYHKVLRLILVEDVYEGLYVLGEPEPCLEGPDVIPDGSSSDEEGKAWWEKNQQALFRGFFAMAKLYLITKTPVEGEKFPSFNTQLNSQEYEDLKAVHELYGKFLEARRTQDEQALATIRFHAQRYIRDR